MTTHREDRELLSTGGATRPTVGGDPIGPLQTLERPEAGAAAGAPAPPDTAEVWQLRYQAEGEGAAKQLQQLRANPRSRIAAAFEDAFRRLTSERVGAVGRVRPADGKPSTLLVRVVFTEPGTHPNVWAPGRLILGGTTITMLYRGAALLGSDPALAEKVRQRGTTEPVASGPDVVARTEPALTPKAAAGATADASAAPEADPGDAEQVVPGVSDLAVAGGLLALAAVLVTIGGRG